MAKYYYTYGSSRHPEKVIAALEAKGGKNTKNRVGENGEFIYYINKDGVIEFAHKYEYDFRELLKEFGERIWIEPDYRFGIGDKMEVNNGTHKFVSTVTEQFNGEGKAYYKVADKGDIRYPESQLFPSPESQVLTWEDMEKKVASIRGFYITSNSYVCDAGEPYVVDRRSKSCYHSESQAKSALAMAQISQLIELPAYGCWCPFGEKAFIIGLRSDGFGIWTSKNNGGILRFHKEAQARLFLKHNEQLVLDYLMID